MCTKRKTAPSGSGYEELKKCVTENSARTLQIAGLHDEYPFLQSEVGAGVDWQIIAREYYRVYKKKLNKPEIAHRLCKAPQCTKFFIEIGCLGTDNVM